MVEGNIGGYDSRGNFRTSIIETGEEGAEFNVGSPWVELTQDVRVVNGNSDETDARLASSKSRLFTVDDGNLISLSEKYGNAEEGKSEHSIVLKILDPDGIFIQNFIDNSYGRLYQSVFSRIAKIGEHDYLRQEATEQMIEQGNTLYNTSEYVKKVTDLREAAKELRDRANATPKHILTRLEDINEAERLEREAARNEFRILEGGAKKALKRLEKNRSENDFDIFEVSSTLQEELGGTQGVTEQLNAIVRNNQQVFLRYGFGLDYRKSNTWRKFQIATLFNISDSSDNGMLEIKLVPLDDIGKDLRRTSAQATKTPEDINDTRYSVSVPLAQIKKRARRRYDEPLTFNEQGGSIDDLQFLKTVQVEEVLFNNTNNIVSVLENLLSKYIQKNIGTPMTKFQGSVPIVFLHPLLQKHIEDKISSYKISYNPEGEPLTDKKAIVTKGITDELLRIESLKKILGDSGIEITITNESDPETKDENELDRFTIQTFNLTFRANAFDSYRRPLVEKNVFNAIRYLYAAVDLNIPMYKTLEGEVFDIQNETLKSMFIKRLFIKDQSSKRFVLNVLDKAKPFVTTTSGYNSVATAGGRLGGPGTIAPTTMGQVLAFNSANVPVVVYSRGDDEISVANLFENGLLDSGYGFTTYNVKVYGDSEVISSLIAPMTVSLKKAVVDNFVSRVNSLLGDGADEHALVNRFIKYTGEDFANYVIQANQLITVVNPKTPLEGFNEDFELLMDGISPEIKESLNGLPMFTANYKDANVHQVVSKGIGESFAFLQGNTLFDLFDDQGVKELQQFFEPSDRTFYKSKDFKDLSEQTFALMIPKILRAGYTGNSSIMNLLDTLSQDIQNLDRAEKNPLAEFRIADIIGRFSTDMTEALKQSTGDRKISSTKMLSYFVYLQHLANSVRKISIKTIPRFNMLREHIGKPCVFLNYNNFYAYISNRLNEKGFLSGIYTIFGYEHTISGSECSSSFFLQRNELANLTANSIFSEAIK